MNTGSIRQPIAAILMMALLSACGGSDSSSGGPGDGRGPSGARNSTSPFHSGSDYCPTGKSEQIGRLVEEKLRIQKEIEVYGRRSRKTTRQRDEIFENLVRLERMTNGARQRTLDINCLVEAAHTENPDGSPIPARDLFVSIQHFYEMWKPVFDTSI